MKQDESRRLVRTLLALWLVAGACLYIAVCLFAKGMITAQAETSDSVTYIAVTKQLLANGELIPTHRSLGYPLLLSLPFALAGPKYALYLTVAIQLLAACWLSVGCWRLLAKLASTVSVSTRVVVCCFFWVAATNVAVRVLTDFASGAFFFVFVYGLLFWRRWDLLALAAACLAAATMIRPTLTYLPLLLPAIAWLGGRVTTKLPKGYWSVLVLASVLGTGVSVVHHFRVDGYRGPSSVVASNLAKTMWAAKFSSEMSLPEFRDAHRDRMVQELGKPRDQITRVEEERITKRVFVEELRDTPIPIVMHLAKTFIKYALVPIDGIANSVATQMESREWYLNRVRPALFVLCLPAWLLCYWPPLRSNRQELAYYALTMVLVVYTLGLSAVAPFQGERMRFPVLILLMPIAAWNLERLRASIGGRVGSAH